MAECCLDFGGWPPSSGGEILLLPPHLLQEGGGSMVTYAELFQYSLVIIGVIGLIVQIMKKK